MKILKELINRFRSKRKKVETRWIFEFNRAQAETNVMLDNNKIYGIPGQEIWASQTGFFEYDWEKGCTGWKRMKRNGDFWIGPIPEKEGIRLDENEFWRLKNAYDSFYDT